MGIFSRLSQLSRAVKMRRFHDAYPDLADLRLLDVGGQLGGQVGMPVDVHPLRKRVVTVNLDRRHLETIRAKYPEAVVVLADARKLPFASRSLDVVFSNAVIEHVGSLQDQRCMSREVMRVGRSWFVTTPNRWFPFEFHLRLPLVSWLPRAWLSKTARIVSYNHVRRRYQRGMGASLRLLSARELKQLFPGADVLSQIITVLPETLIAMGPKQ